MDVRILHSGVFPKVAVLLLSTLVLFARVSANTTVSSKAEAETSVSPEEPTTPEPEVAQPEGDPITCYECTSKYDGDLCRDPIDSDKMGRLSIKECNTANNEFSCYKVVTANSKTESDAVVTRMCASREGGESSWTLDAGSGRYAKRSYCNSDLCNTGHVTFPSAVTWFSGLLSLCAATWMF